MDSIKREYPRKQEKITAMAAIHPDASALETLGPGTKNEIIRFLAETKDISWGGFSLQLDKVPQDSENSFSAEKAHTLAGRQIEVNLANPRLTVWGDILRYDSEKKHMAVVLSKVSDYDLWQELCGTDKDM